MNILSGQQLSDFSEHGYLVVRNLLDPARDLDPVIAEYEHVLDRVGAGLRDRGEVKSDYAGLPFGERLIRLSLESGRVLKQHFDFSLPQRGIREDTPMWVGPAVFAMLRNQRLLDAVEDLIGPEIFSNPVQHVRFKLPEGRAVRDAQGRLLDGATDWHQDNGVVLPEADETDMLTVWFPLWDAPVESGCLQVIAGSHRRGLRDHCPADTGAHIPTRTLAVDAATPVPMRRGDVLFLHRLTCHAALPNRSAGVRWSFDLRYNPIGQATGRGMFPGFVARSRSHPESELRDARRWADLWHEARRKLASGPAQPAFNRWSASSETCA